MRWDKEITLPKPPAVNLKPREVPLPGPRSGRIRSTAFFSLFCRAAWKPPKPVEDRLFARRVYLDMWGLLPLPEAG